MSVAPGSFDESNKINWVFLLLQLRTFFQPHSTVPASSGSKSKLNSSCFQISETCIKTRVETSITIYDSNITDKIVREITDVLVELGYLQLVYLGFIMHLH